MAGYFIYTLDGDAFSKLTTAPTQEHCRTLAKHLLDQVDGSEAWPNDLDALAEAIKNRLTLSDWYKDLSAEDAELWDEVIFSFCSEIGDEIGIGFECSDYESIYWDCAAEAAEQGAEMMKEPTFGNSGYRFFGESSAEYGYDRIYSIFESTRVQELLTQLEAVEPHFASLPNGEEGSVREQFFEGLLPSVRYAAENNRVLFIQTDT